MMSDTDFAGYADTIVEVMKRLETASAKSPRCKVQSGTKKLVNPKASVCCCAHASQTCETRAVSASILQF